MNRKRLIIFILIAGLLLFGIWRLFLGKKQNPQYQTARVEKGTIVSTVSESGQILNANFVTVFTQASGQVSEIAVKDGDQISKGDVIAKIDLDQLGQQRNTQAWANYLQAQSTLNSAKATQYSLQSTMFAKWSSFYNLATNSTYQNADGTPNESNRVVPEFHISQDDWLAAEANYKNQQNVVAQAQANLQNTWVTYQLTSSQITAPMDGVVTNLVIFPGINISNTSSTTGSSNSNVSSQQIAVIKNDQNPLATFNVSEIDINKIKIGQKATLTLDSIAGKTFTGKVVSVDHIGSVTSGVTNYPVIIQFDTTVPEILPNMAINAGIIIATKDDVLLVPSTAIQTSNGQTYLRIFQNGNVQQTPVETGLTSDNQIEITSGAKEGQTVVTSTAVSSNSPTTRSPFSNFGGRGFGR